MFQLPWWFDTLDFGAVLLMYSNAAINPIIYGGLNESFRKGLRDLINGLRNRVTSSVSDVDNDSKFRSVFGRNSTLTSQARRNSRSIEERYRNGNGGNCAVNNISTVQEKSESLSTPL